MYLIFGNDFMDILSEEGIINLYKNELKDLIIDCEDACIREESLNELCNIDNEDISKAIYELENSFSYNVIDIDKLRMDLIDLKCYTKNPTYKCSIDNIIDYINMF